MATYLQPPIQASEGVLLNRGINQVAASVAGWRPSSGSLEVLLLEIMSRMAADQAEVASKIPTDIFRYFGQSVLNLPPSNATRAAFDVVFTVQDAAGYTLPGASDPSGVVTQVSVRDDAGVIHGFELLTSLIITAGQTSGVAEVTAVEVGSLHTDLDLTDDNVNMITSLSYVTNVTPVSSATGGGEDAETDSEYLNRLVDQYQLLALTAVTPEDFRILAISHPSVGRAVAIDLYDPNFPTVLTERTVTVAVIDGDGNAVSAGVRTEVADLLSDTREINFKTYVIGPTYTLIDVSVTVQALPGTDTEALDVTIEDAIRSYLDPGSWGGDSSDPAFWRMVATVRYLELAAVVENVQGVDYTTTLSLSVGGGTLATADVPLTGVAPLPQAGTISVSVTPA